MEGSEGQANRASADDGDFDFLSSHASNVTEYEDVDVDMADALEVELEKAPEDSMVRVVDSEEPRGALVPFAFPLADNDKEVKKILKTVKKCVFML